MLRVRYLFTNFFGVSLPPPVRVHQRAKLPDINEAPQDFVQKVVQAWKASIEPPYGEEALVHNFDDDERLGSFKPVVVEELFSGKYSASKLFLNLSDGKLYLKEEPQGDGGEPVPIFPIDEFRTKSPLIVTDAA